MRLTVKVIIAAMGVAALASPAAAQPRREPWVPVSTDNVYWGLAYGPVMFETPPRMAVVPAYGSVGRRRAARRLVPAPGGPTDGIPRILDCVHIPFPQCSSGPA